MPCARPGRRDGGRHLASVPSTRPAAGVDREAATRGSELDAEGATGSAPANGPELAGRRCLACFVQFCRAHDRPGGSDCASPGPEGGAGMAQATPPYDPSAPRAMPGASDRRILIVEDDDFTVAALRSILELMFGQQDVWIAHDGHEGIRLAYEHPPDLILMDLALPKLDGWEVTRSLRSNPRFKQTPILAVSAHAMVGDREKALAAGCNDYFPKPIEVDEFVRFMRPYLEVR